MTTLSNIPKRRRLEKSSPLPSSTPPPTSSPIPRKETQSGKPAALVNYDIFKQVKKKKRKKKEKWII